MLTIPPLAEKDFFTFRFKDDNIRTRRQGALVETKAPIPKLKSNSKYDYHNKKHHEVMQTHAHLLNWCVYCDNQADVILVYKIHGVWCREKYCSAHAKENIIKL